MVTPFREIEVPNFNNIQEKLLPYLLNLFPDPIQFWNYFDYTAMFRDNPEFVAGIEQAIGQTPIQAYLLIVPDKKEAIDKLGENSIHRDDSVESCRLNWPVLNGPSIETRFFSADAELKEFVKGYRDDSYFRYKESTVIATLRLKQPTVVNVHNIHGLYPAEGPLPRYVLTIKFDKDISHFLK